MSVYKYYAKGNPPFVERIGAAPAAANESEATVYSVERRTSADPEELTRRFDVAQLALTHGDLVYVGPLRELAIWIGQQNQALALQGDHHLAGEAFRCGIVSSGEGENERLVIGMELYHPGGTNRVVMMGPHAGDIAVPFSRIGPEHLIGDILVRPKELAQTDPSAVVAYDKRAQPPQLG